MLLFLETQYLDRDVMFWPDHASAQYARKTIEGIEETGVPVVGRGMDPLSGPQILPIKDLLRMIMGIRDVRRQVHTAS